jgi:hypothetical protein
MAFCAFDSMGSVERNDTTFVYLWTLCMAFDSVSDESLARGSGASLPVVVAESVTDSGPIILGHWEPRDGEGYGAGVRRMFPTEYVDEVFNPVRGYNVRARSLEQEVTLKARAYFGVSR